MKKFFLALSAAAIFTAAVASESNVSQKFYDYGFELTSKSPQASNNLRKEGVFQFKLNNPNIFVISDLRDLQTNEPVPNATWTDRVGSELTIVVDVPNARKHRAFVYACKRTNDDKKDFEPVFYFDVQASEGYKGYGADVVSYPTPFNSYSEVMNTHIVSPIRGALQEGEIARFEIQSKDFSKIGFRINNKVIPFKKSGEKFELETKVPAGIDKLGIYGTKNGKKFTGLWYYKVQKDRPKTKYDDDEQEEISAPEPQPAQTSVNSAEPKYTKDQVDASVWDLSKLDTARNADYMFEVEKNVILEMNMARSNPKKYAELYIEPRLKKFNGTLYDRCLRTKEGAAAVTECVKVMNAQQPLAPFQPSKGLTRAAKDHSSTQSLTNQVGHAGTDGSSPFDRIKRYGSYMTAGENIDYGCSSAREIVVSLLVDDGVESRGHRKNIMNKNYTTVGVGYADAHKVYRCMCVIDFTGKFDEKK